MLRWLPAVAILAGLLTRSGSSLTWLVQPCLMAMMLAAFTRTDGLRGWRPGRFLGTLLAFQIIAAAACFLVLRGISVEAAHAFLLLALTPTAVSATAVATSTGADDRTVTSTIAATSLVACLTLPLVAVVDGGTSLPAASLVVPARLVATTVLVPYLAALALLHRWHDAHRWFAGRTWRVAARLLWSSILWVAASKVGDWYVVDTTSGTVEAAVPLIVGASAFATFAASGYLAAGAHRVEGLICYAHKNTGLALLVILYSLPMTLAAGVLAYTLVQNAFFSLLRDKTARPVQT